jgi:hypothetical protein
MTELLATVNNIREETITTQYNAAFAELQDKIKTEPLRTNFDIYSGCVSEEVAKEIAHRFNIGGTKATVAKYGFLLTAWYLQVEINLPENLVHEVPVAPSTLVPSTSAPSPVEPISETPRRVYP